LVASGATSLLSLSSDTLLPCEFLPSIMRRPARRKTLRQRGRRIGWLLGVLLVVIAAVVAEQAGGNAV
jgi:uncharacterized sodium:solute symporter family permease YidK